ncbi:MAG: tRNA 4-thiouridine(8) synthase ThiI [Clostridiales bacterium]|nr:tRNA 4-thiouridine(8) synthase ThiI [Clostridiales bacterium]
MNEVILCKYGEIILKGANRSNFEGMLIKSLKRRARRFGDFAISRAQSTIFIKPLNQDSDSHDKPDIDGMYQSVLKVFGIAGVARAAVAEKNIESIKDCAAKYLPAQLSRVKTFKVEAKRSDKTFPMISPEISAEVGGVLLEVMPHLKVDLSNPDVVVRVEIREDSAYVHAGQQRGAGGIPVGTGGRGLLLLSGGIDSPVAGFMMAKRGVVLDALHFESYPYTSERAKLKVLSLAQKMSEYCERIYVHIISLTKIQEEIKRNCEEDYFTIILRRFMMTLAERQAEKLGCGALITGESLGQVASQTMEAISVTDSIVSMPVFRPCIGLDKEEIVRISRQIDTYDISILPYEDCCTVFTPKHPRTKPILKKVLAQEKLLDFEALCDEAMQTLETVQIRPDRPIDMISL